MTSLLAIAALCRCSGMLRFPGVRRRVPFLARNTHRFAWGLVRRRRALEVAGVLAAVVTSGLVLNVSSAFAQAPAVKAFPTAEGFGKDARGGRGGTVRHVTNLNDSGAGSLRAAVEASGARTVVFRVDGTIVLNSPLRIDNGRITIAGQSAPGDGICVAGRGLDIMASDVIVRYLRFRPGDIANADVDGIWVSDGNDIIIDHCSVSWGVDETLSVTPDPDNVTVQWCLISESLHDSVHSTGNPHGKGSLIRGRDGAKYSFHHNLYAHHVDRIPQVSGLDPAASDASGVTLDFRNNVIYNWGSVPEGWEAAGANRSSDAAAFYNFVGNDYRRGPDTLPWLMPVPEGWAWRYWAFEELCPYAQAWFGDNALDGALWSNPWLHVSIKNTVPSGYKRTSPVSIAGGEVATDTAAFAKVKVLARAGASHVRDAVDLRIVSEVENGTGSMIDSQNDVGGWPALTSATPPADSDGDGIPDSVEIEWGLNRSNPNDGPLDRNGDGYTNLEEYLNGLVDTPMTYLVNVAAEGGGSVSPDGGVPVTEFDTVTFTATPDAYWHVASVLLDGVQRSIGEINALGPIVQNHSVHVTFAPDVTAGHGTPHYWLVEQGLHDFENDEVVDHDGDGFAAWQEYRLMSSPWNAASGPGVRSVPPADAGGESYPALSYRRPADVVAAGVTAVIEQSGDMATWDEAAVEQVGDAVANNDGSETIMGTVTVTVRVLSALPGQCYFRVRYDFF